MSIKIIGITGPSGAGKSILCAYLSKRNIPIIDADKVYHSLLVKDSPCTLALCEEFGNEILSPDGIPDRKKLGAIVFSSSEKLKKLNSIVLKFVIEKIDLLISEFEAEGAKAVGLDAPTLIESGFSKNCDTVISVLAKKDTRVERICARDSISKEAALLRVNAQKPDAFYIQNSSLVITNNADEESFFASVDEIFDTIIPKES